MPIQLVKMLGMVSVTGVVAVTRDVAEPVENGPETVIAVHA